MSVRYYGREVGTQIHSNSIYQVWNEFQQSVWGCAVFVSYIFSDAIMKIERPICSVGHVFIPLFASCISLFHTPIAIALSCTFQFKAQHTTILLDLMDLISNQLLNYTWYSIHSVCSNRNAHKDSQENDAWLQLIINGFAGKSWAKSKTLSTIYGDFLLKL